MHISEEGLELIKHFEGCPLDEEGNAVAYQDAVGVWTIGYGHTKDVQDAREKFSNDWTPKILGISCAVGFFSYIAIITLYPQPEANDDVTMIVIGAITGIFTSVISFYFGSSNKK